MDQQWLMRIGLTLTLLASLLITPDLVGIARWRSLQRTFSEWADSLKEALAGLGHQPTAGSGLLQYLANILSDVFGGIAILIVTVTAGLLLFTAVPAFLVASWLGAVVLAIWGSLFVLAAWAIQVQRVLRERSQRNAGATVARLLVSPVTGSARFAVDWFSLLLVAAIQVRMLACRRASRAAGSVAVALTREGELTTLLLPTGLLCLIVGTALQIIATL